MIEAYKGFALDTYYLCNRIRFEAVRAVPPTTIFFKVSYAPIKVSAREWRERHEAKLRELVDCWVDG